MKYMFSYACMIVLIKLKVILLNITIYIKCNDLNKSVFYALK